MDSLSVLPHRTLPPEVSAVLDHIEAETGAGFSDVSGRVSVPYCRSDVRALILHPGEIAVGALKRLLKSRLKSVHWQYSELNDRPLLVFAAPMVFHRIDVAFHATRTANLDGILERGLCPSTPERSNSERADCVDNLYVCPTLGSVPANIDVEPEKETAHWWRWHLSRNNRFDDPDWCILHVNMVGVEAKVYRDIWSASGLIIDDTESIASERLSVVWPASESRPKIAASEPC